MYPKSRLITSVQWFVCRHLARISSRKGTPALGGRKVPPTKIRKFFGFGPLFLMNPEVFSNYFILFQYSRQEEGRSTLGCAPAAGRIKSGKIHYGMIPALNTPY